MKHHARERELMCSVFNPRRDHNCWHTNPKSIELEEKGGRASITIQVRNINIWSSDIVIEPTVLVICDDQKGLIPLRTCPQCFINLLRELLPISNIMCWMIIVSWQALEIKVSQLNHSCSTTVKMGSLPFLASLSNLKSYRWNLEMYFNFHRFL
ncbi:hypothetical protein BT93_B0031 [Corymbia citriodora subsp. variegata]|nr:hypothetical protein BT93_B0031 [Corymbia citriodora subsp. variegata]